MTRSVLFFFSAVLPARLARVAALLPVLFLTALLGACSVIAPPATIAVAAPPVWYAPLPAGVKAINAASNNAPTSSSLPHDGSLMSMSQWWRQQNDHLLVELIEAAQTVSPSVITARSNILQAQATRASTEATFYPTLDAIANVSRSRAAPINRTTVSPITSAAQLGLQTSWELDLFGANRASLAADSERLESTQALWHDARVSVAAEVANQYYTLRACHALLGVARSDALSRSETARLNDLSAKAGFTAPATAALARASAAEGRSRLTQQQAQCEVDVKTLVALTATPEPELRQKLSQAPAVPSPQSNMDMDISSVPAEVLGQRPDVYSAARALGAASFEVGSARAQRYPRLSITGNIFNNKTRARGLTQGFDTWSLGPLALTVPLFDGGASEANLEAAKARYEEATGKYRASVRQAVREVEEALVNLQSFTERTGDTAAAAEGYSASFTGTQARYQVGLASLVELEESRRTLLSAQSAVVLLNRDQKGAWVALYRALGGGWAQTAPPAAPMVFDIPESLMPSWP